MPPLAWKKILCPVDFSEESRAALRVAADLSARFDAELTLFHSDSEVVAQVASAPEATGNLSHWRTQAEELGVAHVATATAAGDPPVAIVEQAQSGRFDLIVMGTHGRTGRERQLIGSVAEHVVRSSRVPVLTVHADFQAR
jgi:nucleotide-binding universal stress UspA family protein